MSFSKSKVERFPFNANSRGIPTLTSKGNKTTGSGISCAKNLGSGILKRSYLISPSTSIMSTPGSSSSLNLTPSKKVNLKPRRPLKDDSKVSNSVGSKKSPTQRISMLNRSHSRTVITKPKCSPVYRGKVISMTGKSNQNTPGLKRKQLVTSVCKKTPTPKTKDSVPTPKRKKFDETSDEMYLTPLASPPDSNTDKDESTNDADDSTSTIIFDPQSLSRCLDEAKKSKTIEDGDRETFTPTAPFESTRLDVNETPTRRTSERATKIRNESECGSPENLENILKYVVTTSDGKEEDEATVTTPGRNPSRRSVTKQNTSFFEAFNSDRSVGTASSSFTVNNVTSPDDEHTSRISLGSRTHQWEGGSGSFDFMNDAFLQQQQLSLHGAEPNNHFFQTSSVESQQAVMWDSDVLHLGLSGAEFSRGYPRQRAQSFSCYTNNSFPPVHGQVPANESTELVPPTQPSSISRRIGSLITNIFPKKKKPENVRSAGAERLILAEHNYTNLQLARDMNMRDRSNVRHRPRRLGANSFIPLAFREFIFREPPFQARFNREVLRRLARLIRIETVHTFREIHVSVILPAKMYVKSPEFWMPVLEFVAGQGLEITLTSLTK